jgi:hypothetical protein
VWVRGPPPAPKKLINTATKRIFSGLGEVASKRSKRRTGRNGRKSLGDLKTTRLPRLDGVFEGTKAIDITTTSVERYKTLRLKEKAAPATVNRELASLKRMFRLGLRQGMVATMPYIAMLAEHNVRKGFSELDQFRAILKHLPSEYHALFEIAYITGWRMKSELLRASGGTSISVAGAGCESMPARRRTQPPAASFSSRPGCAKRSNVSASSFRRWRRRPGR